MKKLILAAAVAMIGVMANAAVANWSVDNVYAPGTTDYGDGYLVYYFDTSALTVAAATSALSSGDMSFLSNGYAGADLTDDEGYAEGASGSIYSAGDSVNGYLVIFNSDTAATATYAYVSDVETATINNLGANAALSFGDITATQNASNWTATTAVPEPTSGLLMLLGMVGLALRRRRA